MPFGGHNTRSEAHDVYVFGYVPNAGEANRLVVTASSGASLRVEDAGAPVTPGANCRSDGPNAVVCSPDQTAPGVASRVFLADLDLGDGDDRLALNGLEARVTAGPGDDEVVATGAPVDVDGGPGADTMRGQLPSRISYAGRTGDVAVIQDGQANDGEPGERDNVGPGFATVIGGDGDDELHLDGEAAGTVEGGAGDDRLFGARSNDRMTGGAGDDRLHGLEGDDVLNGGAGGDLVRGGAGSDSLPESYTVDGPLDITLDDQRGDGHAGENDDIGSDVEIVYGTLYDDRLVGSDSDDVLRGQGGGDTIEGRGGADELAGAGRIVGGPGVDRIFVLEGGSPSALFPPTALHALDGERDEIWCSPGTPELQVDAFDALGNCAPAVIGPKPERFRVTRAGTVRMRLRCEPGADIPCAGKVYAWRGDKFLASPVARGRFRLPAGGRSAVVELRLSRGQVAQLRLTRRLPMLLRIFTYRAAPAPSKRETLVQDRTLLAPR